MSVAGLVTPARGRPLPWLAALVAAIVLIAAPFVVGNYWLRVLTSVAMYATVAQGLNVIVGFAGYHAFGNVVFFGIGAYACGVAMTLGAPFPLALVAAVALSAAMAAALGWPLLRLRGHYFAIATVALNFAAVEAIINIGGATGGSMGLALPMSDWPPQTLYRAIYFTMLGAAALATASVWWLSRSPFGYALRALKDSENGAEVMGIDTVRAKIGAWAISAALTGLAGGIWAYWITFIETGSAFDIGISVRGYIMMLLGGMGSVFGPLVGAIFLELFETLIWGQLLHGHQLLLGVLIVAVAMAVPDGILPFLRQRLGKLAR